LAKRPIRRALTALGAAGLVLGFSGAVIGFTGTLASATPQPGAPSSVCTYQDTTAGGTAAQNFIPNVSPGDAIAISCTGLPVSTSVAIAPASTLAGILGTGESAQDFADIAAANLSNTTSATGTLNATFNWPAASGTTGGFTATNTSAQCPPTSAQINAGVVGCTLAIAAISTQAPLNVGTVIFKGTAPAAMTLTGSHLVGKAGDTVNVTGGTNVWGVGFSGAPNTTTGIPAPVITFTDSASTTTSLTPTGYSIGATVFCGAQTAPISAACTGVAANTLVAATPTAAALALPATAAAGAGQLCLTTADQWAADPSASTVPVLPGNAQSGAAEQACVGVTVLGAPTLVANPTSGGQGNTIAVNGTNWDPNLGATATLTYTCGTDTGTASVSAGGALSGSIAVGSTEVTCIPTGSLSVSDPIVATLGTETASAAFNVTGLVTSCQTSGSPSSCNTNQVVTQQVNGVATGLSLDEGTGGTGVTMTPITLNGYQQTSTGSINGITLIDARGTLVGWSAVAQFQQNDFTGPTAGKNPIDHQIPAGNVFLGGTNGTAAPTVVCAVASQPPLGQPSCIISEVTQPASNVALAGPAGSAVSLGSAAAGGGGGSFSLSSGLVIYVPSYIAAGTYTDTLNVTVS
jgi:hypothetical protein